MCVVGARPNFIKIAPILAALDKAGRVGSLLVHTGQHYDRQMNDNFFADLGIRQPEINLEVGSGSHAVQTAEIMKRFDGVIDQHRPAGVLVVGDVNSTLAAALVASKKSVAVFHVEAGLRSFDRSMPEEVNRILTDQLSDLLFVTERDATENLLREGIASSKIHFVGNVMIDALRQNIMRAIPAARTLSAAGFAAPDAFALATLHRPSNVDQVETLARLLDTFEEIGRDLPVVFPIHPRTRRQIEAGGLGAKLRSASILALEPVGYLEMVGLLAGAKLVLTDSGGLQEESTALGIPCLTLRSQTERPITVEQGTSTIVGNDPAQIRAAYADFRKDGGKRGRIPELWDGNAAGRIAVILADWLKAAA